MARHSPDPSAPDQRDPSVDARILAAWKELRRGAAMGALRDHLFGSGDNALEPGQMDTLELLVGHEAWRMSELAEALRVDPSTATRAVQRLVKGGLAQRTTCVGDARVVMVSATDAGHAQHRAIVALRQATLNAMLASFDPEERTQFAGYLDRFVTGLDDFVHHLDQTE